jgi:hypothetical protein
MNFASARGDAQAVKLLSRKLKTGSERFTKLAPGKWEITLEKGQSKFSTMDSQKQQIVSELKRRGISNRTAQDLASQFSAEMIESKIAFLDELLKTNDKRISRNPAGFLAASIRHNYESVPSRNQQRRVAPRSLQVPEKKTIERRDVEAEKFRKYWESLSIDEQARHEREAMAVASTFHRETLLRMDSGNSELKAQVRLRIIREFLAAKG